MSKRDDISEKSKLTEFRNYILFKRVVYYSLTDHYLRLKEKSWIDYVIALGINLFLFQRLRGSNLSTTFLLCSMGLSLLVTGLMLFTFLKQNKQKKLDYLISFKGIASDLTSHYEGSNKALPFEYSHPLYIEELLDVFRGNLNVTLISDAVVILNKNKNTRKRNAFFFNELTEASKY